MPAQPVKERLINEDGESVVVERDPQEGDSLIEREQAAKQGGQLVEAAEPEELEEETRDELYERAQELDVQGRSKMDKEELAEAVAKAEREEAKAEAQALKAQKTATTSEEDAEPAEEIGPTDKVEGEDDE